jgi:hypothetical protein
MQEESGMLLEQLHGIAGRKDLPTLSNRDASRKTPTKSPRRYQCLKQEAA